MSDKNDKNHKIRVAQYLRMSTDHQQYSIHNQAEFIKKYADDHNMEILYTYDDAGRSGLTLEGRHAMQKLLSDVINKNITIEAVLFYDVSRFGRFQQPDEAAYHSFVLNMHGVELIFCADPIPMKEFPLEGSVILNIKRISAAFHSKNISEKVFIGQVNLINRGYHQGGMAGYGLRRLLIDENNSPKEILKFNKRKSIQTDRVRLIPGPKEEIKIVNLIYDLFIEHSMPELLISEKLNEGHIPAENGSLWTRAKVHQILINEKYIGNNVYNRTSGKLKSKTVKNPRSEWIILEKAFKPIVSRRKFFKAQDIIRNRSLHFSDDELLNYLKKKLTENGKLSGFIIDEDDTGPSSSVYRNRFGGLLRAYTLIGYKPEHDYSYIELNNYLREYHWQVLEKFKNDVISKNCLIDDIKYHPLIKINDEISISLILCRCNKLKSGKLRWKVRFDAKLNPDLTIVFRMNKDNSDPLDYYILPKLDVAFSNMIMTEKNNLLLELYRYESLETFLNMIQRIDIRGFYAA